MDKNTRQVTAGEIQALMRDPSLVQIANMFRQAFDFSDADLPECADEIPEYIVVVIHCMMKDRIWVDPPDEVVTFFCETSYDQRHEIVVSGVKISEKGVNVTRQMTIGINPIVCH